jgi:hypothetical protein
MFNEYKLHSKSQTNGDHLFSVSCLFYEYMGNILMFSPCACYSWEMSLNIGLSASFDNV